MKKGVLVLILVSALFILPLVLSGSIDDEFQKLTHYAEEYEIGNIDYAQLLVYTGSVRERLNQELGAVSKEHGGILKQEQIRKMLGEPTEMTKWVWVPKAEHERKVLNPVPVWRKIIFDGRKIQIRLEAFPMIFVKGGDFESDSGYGEEIIVYSLHFEIQFKKPEEELNIKGKIEEIKVVAGKYYANPSNENLKELAEKSVNVEMSTEPVLRQSGDKCENIMNSIFGSENLRGTFETVEKKVDFYSGDNFEVVARLERSREWVSLDFWIEGRGRGFKMSEFGFDEKGRGFTGGVIEVFEKITGFAVGGEEESDNKKESEGEDRESFDDEGVEFEDEREGEFEDNFDNKRDFGREHERSSMGVEEIKRKIKVKVGELKTALENGNNKRFRPLTEEIQKLNRRLNEKLSNRIQMEMENEQMNNEGENHKPYFWIKQRVKMEEKRKQLMAENSDKLYGFYNGLFSGLNAVESSSVRQEWEERLYELFKESGEEICDNDVDDNDNAMKDCEDPQCVGKFAGRQTMNVEEDGVVVEKKVDLFCIEGRPQPKKEEEKKEAVCGNYILDEGESCELPKGLEGEELEKWKEENNYCPDDCVKCPEHGPIECIGEVIFKGEDENGCPLEPICLEEERSCVADDDCNFRCGRGKCAFEKDAETGKCEFVGLTECVTPDCEDGDTRTSVCDNGNEITTDVCREGMWVSLHIECPQKKSDKVCCSFPGDADQPLYEWRDKENCQSPEGAEFGEKIVSDSNCQKKKEKPGVGEECVLANDCGEERVCSNGNCVKLPEKVEGIDCVVLLCQEGFECIQDVGCKPIPGFVSSEESEDVKEENEKVIEVEESEPKEIIVEEVVVDLETQSEESSSEEINEEVTGNVIFNFIIGLFRRPQITGAVTGFEVNENGGDSGSEDGDSDLGRDNSGSSDSLGDSGDSEGGEKGGCPDAGSPPDVGSDCSYETYRDDAGCVSGYSAPICEKSGDNKERYDEDDRDDDRGEFEKSKPFKKDRRKRCGNEAQEKCKEVLMSPCIDECMFPQDRGEVGNFNECQNKCEGEVEIGGCVSKYVELCKEDRWDEWGEYERGLWGENEHQEEKEVFMANGMCSKSAAQMTGVEGNIHFGGWGPLTDKLMRAKNKYYKRDGDWCKDELKNLIKQREEIEKSFNQEFAVWLFEEYLANSAEDWEQSMSGIFELYWNNVDNSRKMVEMMDCVGKFDIDEIMDYNPINIKYKGKHGKLEYWEEVKTVQLPGMDREVRIISPYMRLWIFPPKEFIISEMKLAMKNHEFPGPPKESMKRENEEGLTDEERMFIKRDRQFMKKLREAISAYGSNIDAVVQFKDYETGDIVFNLYVQVNEDVIMKMEPMLSEEVPVEDVKIVIDFELVYEMIEGSMKGGGERIESPPWDRKAQPIQRVKEVVNGIQMFLKVRKILSSAVIIPAESEKDVKDLFNLFFKMMMKGGDRGPRNSNDKREDRGEFNEEKGGGLFGGDKEHKREGGFGGSGGDERGDRGGGRGPRGGPGGDKDGRGPGGFDGDR